MKRKIFKTIIVLLAVLFFIGDAMLVMLSFSTDQFSVIDFIIGLVGMIIIGHFGYELMN